MKNVFYSFISLLIALFFVLLGVIGVIFSWFPAAKAAFIQFLIEDSYLLFLFGIAFIVIGMALMMNIISSGRRQYYHISSGQKSLTIDETVIQNYLNSYWKNLFPKAHVPSKLTLKKNKLYLTVDLPYIPPDQQKPVLERIEKDLSELLATTFGYKEPFYLTASFQAES
jgi:hypothetical protein